MRRRLRKSLLKSKLLLNRMPSGYHGSVIYAVALELYPKKHVILGHFIKLVAYCHHHIGGIELANGLSHIMK